MKRNRKKIASLLLAVMLLLGAMPVWTEAVEFSDVPRGAWYEQYLDKIIWAQKLVGQMNIITGNPDGTFKPNDPVKRGEWLKMLFEAAESSGSQASLAYDAAQSAVHWAGKYYTKAQDDNVLLPDINSVLTDNDKEGGTGQNLSQQIEPLFLCTWEALEQPISRYEMAVILNNLCTNIAMQKTVILTAPEAHITDYADIPAAYLTAVEQCYGKGLLMGDPTGAFHGGDTLTRAEAVTVLYRYLFQDTIQGDGLQEWASYPKVEAPAAPEGYDPSQSFANWLRSGNHASDWSNQYGNIDAEARTRLFGSPDKYYFSSAADAAPYMTTVSVPIWTVDKAGNKYASTTSIQVHKLVAEEVKGIFQMIYDDPEQFPIYGGWSAGGARFTDRMRHSWGCAIDINAYYNCECNTQSGYLRVTCGYGWWPVGHSDSFFAGSMTAPSYYSIGKTEGEYGYSVVKAFAAFGWGWGGNGWSNGTRFDYMHFSILPSGG